MNEISFAAGSQLSVKKQGNHRYRSSGSSVFFLLEARSTLQRASLSPLSDISKHFRPLIG